MDTNITRALDGQLDAIKETLKAIKTGTFSADQKRTVKQTLCAQHDNRYAQGIYAVYLLKTEKYTEATPLLKRIANYRCDTQENQALELLKTNAQYNLGVMYDSGLYIEQSDQKAFECFLLAAKRGHATAQFNVGNMYHNKQYVKQNYKKAFQYFSLAAERYCTAALYNLGVMYYKGEYVEKDLQKAFEYFSLAARQSHKNAQIVLELMRKQGVQPE